MCGRVALHVLGRQTHTPRDACVSVSSPVGTITTWLVVRNDRGL